MKRDPEREPALFGLLINPLPAAARASLLMDQGFSRDLGIKPKFWFPLDRDLAVEIGSLNNALRAAVSGRKSARVSLREGKQRRVKLGLRRGAATIELDKREFAFPDADLLASERPKRSRALSRVLKDRPLLPEEERAWKAILGKRALGDREYMELMTALNATPEAVGKELQKPRNLGSDDFMPDEATYYQRLIAPLAGSTTLSAFIEGELSSARRALLAAHPRPALRRMAYSALAQPLIPFDLLASLRISHVASLLEAEDPFSLLFGFELCRHLLGANDQFAGLGSSFLDKLLLDPARSMARCEIFTGVSLITTIGLRVAARAADAPLFWVRLAALTHAGVLTDALATLPDAKGFLKWAAENFIGAYVWHGVVDRRDAPRWNPDWITPEFIFAELVGRASISLHMLPATNRPSQWTTAVDGAFDRLKDTGRLPAAFFPGPFDDFSGAAVRPSSSEPIFREVEEKLHTASMLSDVPGLLTLAHSVQISERALADIVRLVSSPAADSIAIGAPELPYLRLCAHVAANSRSEALAEAVINRCLYKARNRSKEDDVITELFAVMAEACAACAEARAYGELLGQTAANLCFAIDASEGLSHLESIMDVLGKRDERLIPALAQARAIARTKRPRSAR